MAALAVLVGGAGIAGAGAALGQLGKAERLRHSIDKNLGLAAKFSEGSEAARALTLSARDMSMELVTRRAVRFSYVTRMMTMLFVVLYVSLLTSWMASYFRAAQERGLSFMETMVTTDLVGGVNWLLIAVTVVLTPLAQFPFVRRSKLRQDIRKRLYQETFLSVVESAELRVEVDSYDRVAFAIFEFLARLFGRGRRKRESGATLPDGVNTDE